MLTPILRTIVPALWGSFIGWALALLPILEPLRGQLLAYGDLAVPVISAVIIGAWYALWKWLEPKLPGWLTRILLGSAKTPTYLTADTIPGEVLEDWHEVTRPRHTAEE
ncbi:hypothetical protein [Arthrobacter sp. SDTb3-6]|uniref:hypothetical protein n=1 Tax=Arthrobacter sp. SDTb3-6 TaxID=2713571 RepID=UPI00159D09F9|nr:hypothetical protein [Arthrobacter sp. SDTb3-6]NVM97841.1 hypothetical protein [Arthrobacter sp. SDTb3-6]